MGGGLRRVCGMEEVEGRDGAKQEVLKRRRRQVVERRVLQAGLGWGSPSPRRCLAALRILLRRWVSLHALRRWLLIQDELLPPLDQVPLTAAADFHPDRPSYSQQNPVSKSMVCANGHHARPSENPTLVEKAPASITSSSHEQLYPLP